MLDVKGVEVRVPTPVGRSVVSVGSGRAPAGGDSGAGATTSPKVADDQPDPLSCPLEFGRAERNEAHLGDTRLRARALRHQRPEQLGTGPDLVHERLEGVGPVHWC